MTTKTNCDWTLSDEDAEHFKKNQARFEREGKPMVLWGWKRDKVENGIRFPESRTVYFSADLDLEGDKLCIKRAYFFLDTRAKKDEIKYLRNQIETNNGVSAGQKVQIRLWNNSSHPNYSRLRLAVGTQTEYDKKTVSRRLKGKPRLSIHSPRIVPNTTDYNMSKYAPFILCVGSGLSSESGLSLLGTIHNLYEVDNWDTGQLIFGAEDNLPRRVVSNIEKEFENFCHFDIEAIKAQPSRSHHILANLYHKGIIRKVYTDNVDDIFSKVNVPYTQTRRSIFPDRFQIDECDPAAKSLLVIGVAVDRRGVIKQARRTGLKIIAVNPIFGVAPHSRNMDYMCQGDIFFREKAEEALPKIVAASKF